MGTSKNQILFGGRAELMAAHSFVAGVYKKTPAHNIKTTQFGVRPDENTVSGAYTKVAGAVTTSKHDHNTGANACAACWCVSEGRRCCGHMGE